jgi:hypothetical protein
MLTFGFEVAKSSANCFLIHPDTDIAVAGIKGHFSLIVCGFINDNVLLIHYFDVTAKSAERLL